MPGRRVGTRRLAGAEAEARDEEDRQAGRRAGERRERRPPEHDAREYATRAGAIAEVTARDLEERVRNREGDGDPAEVLGRDVQVGLHPRQATEMHTRSMYKMTASAHRSARTT